MTTMSKEAVHNTVTEEIISFEALVSELGVTIKSFKINIRKEVKEVLLILSKEEQEVLLNAIYQIPGGELKKLSDAEGLYSLKVEGFRMTYTVQKNVITIIILKRE